MKPLTYLAAIITIPSVAFWASYQAPAENTEKVDRIFYVRPWESIQAKIDELGSLGGGGTILLDAEATYPNTALKIPALPNYSHISIIGRNTRLVSPAESQSSVIHVGIGWDDWSDPKLEGLRLEGLIIQQVSLANPGTCKGILVEFTKGAVIKDCEIVQSPFEGIYESGGTSNEQLQVIGCRAVGCGLKWNRGPLAAFNLNGFGSTLRDSTADNCGWGLESGGTELRVESCSFRSSPLALGSTVYGCSNQVLSGNTFERSPITIGNGIGRMSDVQIVGNTLHNSSICWNGAALQNRVNLPGLPWHEHTSLIAGNLFVGRGSDGQAIRLTAWDASVPSMPLKVQSNVFECDPGQAIVVQGRLANPVKFVDNSFPADAGRVFLYLPGGVQLPDPTGMMKFERNRTTKDAWLTVNDGKTVKKQGIN